MRGTKFGLMAVQWRLDQFTREVVAGTPIAVALAGPRQHIHYWLICLEMGSPLRREEGLGPRLLASVTALTQRPGEATQRTHPTTVVPLSAYADTVDLNSLRNVTNMYGSQGC